MLHIQSSKYPITTIYILKRYISTLWYINAVSLFWLLRSEWLNWNLLFIVREGGKFRIKARRIWGLMCVLSWFMDGHVSSHSASGGLWSLQAPLRSLITFMKAPLSWPNHCPKALPPDTITLGIIRLQHELGGSKYSVPSMLFLR